LAVHLIVTNQGCCFRSLHDVSARGRRRW